MTQEGVFCGLSWLAVEVANERDPYTARSGQRAIFKARMCDEHALLF